MVGHKFLYVFEGHWIEVIYTIKGFKHLTGVDSYLSANAFFDDAINRRLSASDIFFNARHPYRLAVRKIQHLSKLPNLATEESFFLQNISTATQTYKFGATDLDFTLLFNLSVDSATGVTIKNNFHVESLRDGDCFDKSSNVYEVTHIISKKNNQRLYDTINYIDKRYSIDDLPESVKQLTNMDTIKYSTQL